MSCLRTAAIITVGLAVFAVVRSADLSSVREEQQASRPSAVQTEELKDPPSEQAPVQAEPSSQPLDYDNRQLMPTNPNGTLAEEKMMIQRQFGIYNAWGQAFKQCMEQTIYLLPGSTTRARAIDIVADRCRSIANQLPGMLKYGGFVPKDFDYMTEGRLRQEAGKAIDEEFFGPRN
ncbi:hypothetical protein [Novosphingobium sp.]|uniref:hypothetical protein n=1 Tax=Novosphingobium sp. TaxID=1874826 RepID=UPI00262E6B5D|nr:hypothetical protein [Novosphingobium sp.]